MKSSASRTILLATDLDGTFLAGKDEHKFKLYSLLSEADDVILVFVTGRGLQTVTPLFILPEMPRPEYIICDVGATIVQGDNLLPVSDIMFDIETAWPGAGAVYDVFNKLPGLTYQEVPMERRSSYFYNEETDFELVAKHAEELGVDILVSHGKYIDVLPKGVNKGSTLKKLVNSLGHNKEDILVAGDTLNDLSLFLTGYKGVAVAGSEEGLIKKISAMSNVIHSEHPGTGGIIDAMRHYFQYEVGC